MITKTKTESSRLSDDFTKRIFYSPDGCWYWIGSKFGDGYGDYKGKVAHRISFSMHKNIDPLRLPVKHTCNNRLCVNPHHLFLPTDVEEMAARLSIIEKYSMPEPNTGCWLWHQFLTIHGYGQLTFRKKIYKAHRFSYETFIGKIPKGLFVCHKCDEPSCINPDHLFLGTHLDNVKDMVNKKRHSFGERKINSKVTAVSAQIIRECWSKFGRGSQDRIASYFNISQSNVSMIASRITWNML
jgi:hypothetical protein